MLIGRHIRTVLDYKVMGQFICWCKLLVLIYCIYHKEINADIMKYWSRDGAVVIATRYGLEGPEIESRWGEICRTYPDRLWGPPSPLYNGYQVFPGGKGGRGMMLTTHPLLVPRLRKS